MRLAAITLSTGKVIPDLLCEVEYSESGTFYLGDTYAKTVIPMYTLYVDRGKFEHCQEGRDFQFLDKANQKLSTSSKANSQQRKKKKP